MTVKPWSFDRSLSLGDVLVFASLMAAGIGYVMHQDQRTTRVEQRAETLEQADRRMENAMQSQKDDLAKRLDRFEEKLDRLVERGGR